MESTRIHFDLSKEIRMTIEQGSSIKILRRRTPEELDDYLDILTGDERDQLIGTVNSLPARGGTKRVDYLEERLEAMYLGLLIYGQDLDADNDGYGVVLAKLQNQEKQLTDYRKEIVEVRKYYREIAKGMAGHKLDNTTKAARASAIKEVKDKMLELKKSVGKNEVLRRKIARYKNLLYIQEDTWPIDSAVITDAPLEITITDYGVGHILFEANGGKSAFIFKDKLSLNKSLKASKKLTHNRSVRMLDKESYVWLIGGQPLRISGNGGSFTFAQDKVRISDGFIDIPVTTNKPLKIHSVSNPSTGGKKMKIDQPVDMILVTNLPGYGLNPILTLDEDGRGVLYNEGGTITVQLIEGVRPEELRTKDIPGYTSWIKFLTGDVNNPYTVDNVTTNYYMFRVRITFSRSASTITLPEGSVDIPAASKPSLPLLFRGFINIGAIPRDWKELEGKPADVELIDMSLEVQQRVGYQHIIEAGDNLNGNPYTINIEPTYNEKKRRVVYQVALTYKEGLPTDVKKRVFDYMSGKRCDIEYIYNGVTYKIMTDGIIGDTISEDMLTVTSPPDPTTAVIRGFYHYGATKTIFNVMDSLRFMEDKLMSEGLVLDGYHFKTAIHTILVNSGFTEDKIDEINANVLSGIYVNATNPNEKYLPVALPGQKHGFVCDENMNRLNEISSIIERYGHIPEGDLDIWVDRDGKVKLDGPINIGKDPRWNHYFFYRSRPQAQTLLDTPVGSLPPGPGPAPSPLNIDEIKRSIYFSPITRKRTLDDFFSVLRVKGAPHHLTGKPLTVGFVKDEVIQDKYRDEAIYLGHHKEMPIIDLQDAKTQEELISMLYYNVNQHVGIKEIWTMKVPFNPFILPLDIIFVAPDNRAGNQIEANGGKPRQALSGDSSSTLITEPSASIAWKVVNIAANISDDDTMIVTMVPPNRQEMLYLKKVLGETP
jgi:hypothetical protein